MNQKLPIKILYVEDDINLNKEYQSFFERRCDELFVAYNGEEGFNSFLENKPDIIITDLRMPKLNGIDMIQKIRKLDKDILIIITTAFNEQDYLLEAINLGVSRYVLKPFNRKLLKQVIDETITFINIKKNEEYYKKITKDYYEIIDNNILSSRTDLKGVITYVSKAFSDASGYSKEELIGFSHNIVSHPEMDKNIYKNLWETIQQDKTWQGELKNKSKDGNYYWVKISINPIYDMEGIKIGYSSVTQNISDKKRLEELSIKDSLTNIYNRRYFNEKIVELLNISKRKDESICLLMIDIDYFKLYNDNYGHQKGDDVLIKVAKTLNSFMKRAGDYCFRVGGEEFAILFNSVNLHNSITFSNKIRTAIENLKIEHSHNKVSKYITISIGLYYKNAKEIDNDINFYKKADELLYKAKEEGRNKVVFNDKI